MRRWFLLPPTKHCQLSHTHSELHIMNKPRMTDFNTEANKMFLQQFPLTGLAPRKRSWMSSSDIQSFWKYLDEKHHQPSFMCWFTLNQQESLGKGSRTSLLCSPYMSCTVQHKRQVHNMTSYPSYGFVSPGTCIRTWSKQQSIGQWEKPRLDVKMSTDTVTGPQKLNV